MWELRVSQSNGPPLSLSETALLFFNCMLFYGLGDGSDCCCNSRELFIKILWCVRVCVCARARSQSVSFTGPCPYCMAGHIHSFYWQSVYRTETNSRTNHNLNNKTQIQIKPCDFIFKLVTEELEFLKKFALRD
jgi:hypothetical protein